MLKRCLAVLLLSLLAGPALAREAHPAPAPRAFLWEVRAPGADGKRAWLLGSVHMGRAEHYPLPGVILRAFAESKTLVLEARPDDTRAQPAFFARGALPAQDSLDKHLSPQTMKLLQSHLQRLKIPAQQVLRLRPWLAAILVSVTAMQQLGLSPQLGIDLVLFKQALAAKMKVAELEGYARQLALFESFSAKEQELFLRYSLIKTAKLKRQVDDLYRAWRRGDPAALLDLITASVREQPELRSMYKKLMDDRNEGMARRIDALLKEPGGQGPFFFVAGAGHMVGPVSVVQQLQKMGYTVTQR